MMVGRWVRQVRQVEIRGEVVSVIKAMQMVEVCFMEESISPTIVQMSKVVHG